MRSKVAITVLVTLLPFLAGVAWSYRLVSDNGTDHRYYDIVGSPLGRVRVESSGSRKGVRYQYRVKIDDNESTPNTFQWRSRRYSPPLGEFGDNTTGVALSDSGNATLNNGDVYFDLGNATGNALGAEYYYLSDNATGYLDIPFNLAPKGTRCLKIRAVGDNDMLVSEWVQWCYGRATFDGNFTYDENSTPVPYADQYYNAINSDYDVVQGGHSFGLQMGSH